MGIVAAEWNTRTHPIESISTVEYTAASGESATELHRKDVKSAPPQHFQGNHSLKAGIDGQTCVTVLGLSGQGHPASKERAQLTS